MSGFMLWRICEMEFENLILTTESASFAYHDCRTAESHENCKNLILSTTKVDALYSPSIAAARGTWPCHAGHPLLGALSCISLGAGQEHQPPLLGALSQASLVVGLKWWPCRLGRSATSYPPPAGLNRQLHRIFVCGHHLAQNRRARTASIGNKPAGSIWRGRGHLIHGGIFTPGMELFPFKHR